MATKFSNYQKLAAVLSEWARPAISQIASSRLAQLPFMRSIQTFLEGSGIVGRGYNIVQDIDPFVKPVIDSIITPLMEQYFKNIPDNAIPQTAGAIIEQMKKQGSVSLLNGLVTIDKGDIDELSALIDKNLPYEKTEEYKVIH